jgi:hypothetical protein
MYMSLTDYPIGVRKNVLTGAELTNFWPPEGDFVWSTSSWCEIRFAMNASALLAPKMAESDSVVDVAIDLDTFRFPPDKEGQNVFIYLNGLRLASRFVSHRVTVLLEAPASILRPVDNVVTIDTPDFARPSDYGDDDMRRLGIKLYTLHVG